MAAVWALPYQDSAHSSLPTISRWQEHAPPRSCSSSLCTRDPWMSTARTTVGSSALLSWASSPQT
eukprot:7912478-Lingulodinium_polyedra.AAC.1